MQFNKIAFNNNSAQKSSSKWKWILGIFVGVPLVLALHLALLSFLILKLHVVELFFHLFPQPHMQGVNILAYGIDETRQSKRSDTIMVFHLDKENKRIGILSIPRDTRVNIDGHGKTRINHAFSYGGRSLLSKTVSDLLAIPIDYYIKIDLSGISELIDEIGGLDINVEQELKYTDRAGDLFIDIPKGQQHLNGEQAIQYLRFRYDDQGDIGRINRQQKFISEVTNKLLSVDSLYKTPTIVKLINKVIDTDLDTAQMIHLLLHFKEALNLKRVEKATVPGANTLIGGAYYWRPNITALDKVVETLLFGSEALPKLDTLEKEEKQIATVKQVKEPKLKKGKNYEELEFVELTGKVETEELLPNQPLKAINIDAQAQSHTEELVAEPAGDTSEKASKAELPKETISVQATENKVIKKEAQRRQPTAEEIKRVADATELSIEELDLSLTIEVLNGIGVNGIARKTASLLKMIGLSVPRFENAGHFSYEDSIIIAWKGNIDMAVSMANIFQIDPSNIIVYERPSKPLDITLVIGKDWLAKEDIFTKIRHYAKNNPR